MKRTSSAKASILDKLAKKDVPTSALVESMRREGYTADESVSALIELQAAKKLVIEEPTPHSGILGYALSPYALWFWAVVASVAASVGLVSVTTGAALYARYVFGSALVLFLPGYALIQALYPKGELDELTRFALSIGLSLALTPLTGLVLNYTPFGIRLLPVTFSLAGLTVALLCVSLYRKFQYYKLGKGVV